MASGASKRFGENKLLYSFNGKKLYRYLIDELVTLTKYQIIVVTSYEEIKKEVESIPKKDKVDLKSIDDRLMTIDDFLK